MKPFLPQAALGQYYHSNRMEAKAVAITVPRACSEAGVCHALHPRGRKWHFDNVLGDNFIEI